MKYLMNFVNAVQNKFAVPMTATNTVPSLAIFRTDTAPKAGGGAVSVAGPYTGQSDTTIDVEIVDETAGSNPHVSAPVFSGVGNGSMTDVSVISGTSAQTFVVTLEDLGTITRKAYAPFQSVTLRARTAGAAGNAITVTIDASALVSTATDFALSGDLTAGQNEYIGDVWNFGAATLNPDGTVPATAPRIRFGIDPQVYRAWRKYVAGQYVYGFSPAPVRSIAKGTRVYSVTGTRTVVISDGLTTDTLTGIVTLYDCLSAIRDSSVLVEVDGVIVSDMQPGGQGVTDLSVWTQPYVTNLVRNGSTYVEQADISILPNASAPTEQLNLTCISSDGVTWGVRGDVSGNLDNLTVGSTYTHGDYTIMLDAPVNAPTEAPGARIDVEFIPMPRGVGETMPGICFEKMTLGAKASNGTFEFVYAHRPPAACDCRTGALSGGPNEDCLGTNDGENSMAAQNELRRYQRLVTRVRELIGSNANPLSNVQSNDVDWIRKTSQILAKALPQISGGTIEPDAWIALHAYTIDTIVSAGNGYRYAATVAGTSASTAPSWPTTVGATVSDGTVTWQNIGKLPFAMWDDAFAQWSIEASVICGIYTPGTPPATSVAWTPSHASVAIIRPTLANRNGCIYAAPTGSGSGAATEPAWTTFNYKNQVDGSFTYATVIRYWNPSYAYGASTVVTPYDGRMWIASADGVSGATEPDWWGAADGATLTDGTIVWKQLTSSMAVTFAVPNEFYDRYRTRMEEVLIAAGVVPSNFDGAGSTGGTCWQDSGDDYWWAYGGDRVPPLLPVQNGRYYHSAILDHDENGDDEIVSTQEFGFGPRIGCPESLKVGDIIRVTIAGIGTGGSNGYKQGDTISAQVTRATPLPFGGGQTGNDTLTWSVVGSVAGRLDDYALVTTAPAPYSDAGVEFAIAQGGIGFALGDSFKFSVEGGHFHWRRDGGAWSADTEIGDTSLGDGLTLSFAGGAAPSWITGDAWTYRAEAVNGCNAMRYPSDPCFAWTESTQVDIDFGYGRLVSGVLIAGHTIGAGDYIQLQASNDNFVTTTFDHIITWRAGNIWIDLGTSLNSKKWRLTITSAIGGSIQWLWMGVPQQLVLPSGIVESGRMTKRWKTPTLGRSAALGATITHTAVSDASLDAFLELLNSACAIDDGRIGIVNGYDNDDPALMRFAADSLEIGDEFDFQPDPTKRLLRLSLDLEAVQ